MAKRDNIEKATENAIQGLILEKGIEGGILTVTEDGIIKAEADIKEVEAQLRLYTQQILEEYGEVLEILLDPQAFTILAESLTATDLREAGVAEDLVQLFDKADTSGRETVLDLLEPIVIINLYAGKGKQISAQLRERAVADSTPIAERIKADLMKKITTATPESLQGMRGLLRADMDLLEQSIKREARETTDENSLTIAFAVTGEYPDGTKWERPATPEEEETYRGYME